MRFGFGQFYGFGHAELTNSAVDLRLMAASGAEHHVQEHVHETAHCVLVLAGGYISSAHEARADRRPPLLIYNPPGTQHRDRFRNGQGLFLSVSLSPATCIGMRPVLSESGDARALRSAAAFAAAFRIVRELQKARDLSVCESYAWELFGSANRITDATERSECLAREAYSLIMDRATETELTVRDVAAAIRLHPVHLARVFRQRWGCAPAELMRWRRLACAAALLRHTTRSAAEIAAETGFADQSHLTRSFRVAYGVTPTLFRRQNVARIQDPPWRLR